MPRRDAEISFNSDSFLDVVANLVGVLIILIVLAGVKVSQAPVFLPRISPSDEPVAALPALPAPLTDPGRIAAAPTPVVEPEPVVFSPVPEPIPEFPPLPEVAPRQAQIDGLKQLEQELRTRQSQLSEQQQRLEQLVAERKLLESELDQSQSALQSEQERVASSAVVSQESEKNLQALRNQVATAQQELARITTAPPPVKQLNHQLTPVGRVVTGKEVHFRLSGNRISYVPMDELVERLKTDIERRKEVMLTRPAYQGTVGPLQGYTLDYVMQRDGLTLSEEFKYGSGVMRMSVTGWILRPSPDVASESLEEALHPESLFHQRLYSAGTAATVTCWVYPDSFELHRTLKQHTHEIGYWVASRPLPEGVPIAGSPNGSKSLAQ